MRGFWQEVRGIIERRRGGLGTVLLMGANARVGNARSDAVGDIDGVKEDAAGAELHETLRAYSLCLPATLVVEPGDGCAWTSPDATIRRRLAYIAVPLTWLPRVARAYVDREIDLSLKRSDHSVPVVEVRGHFMGGEGPPARPRLGFDRTHSRRRPSARGWRTR